MLTLKPHKENEILCHMRTGNKTSPVYFHPRIDKSLRNTVDDLGCFFDDEEFTDRWELTDEQGQSIKQSLVSGSIPEKHSSKFFKVKKHIGECLVNQMDLSGTSSTFEIHFPPKNEYAASEIICGASNSGKTHYTKNRILRNLNRKPSERRHFYYFSAEWHDDLTLNELKAERYRDLVTGIDVGEDSVDNSEYSTPQEFFNNEIKVRINHAERGSVIVFDDPSDAHGGLNHLIRNLQNRLMRVGRHRGLGLMFLTHNLRGGAWTSQCSNSCKWFTLFPKSQSSKIRDFLNRDLGLTLPEARRAVKKFKQTGRVMSVRMFSPNSIIGEKFLMLL